MPSTSRAAIEAELRVLNESLERYRDRLAAIAQSATLGAGAPGGGADDLISAVHEAERALRSANRHVERAIKLAR